MSHLPDAAYTHPVDAHYIDPATGASKRGRAVWTLAHRGYSGNGRLDIWVYPDADQALRAGAELALACGLDESDPDTVTLFTAGQYEAVLHRYEAAHPDGFLLRVQEAILTAADLQEDFGVPSRG